MAKTDNGILGGFRGSVGTVIGYQWRGRWCMRSKPRRVANPQTEAQQEHRMLFREMVRMASRLNAILRIGLHDEAVKAGMTEGNLFVNLNKECFGGDGVDYESFMVADGPVAPVAFGTAVVDDSGVFSVPFEKNPLHMQARNDDMVWVVAYCPETRQCELLGCVRRGNRRFSTLLPDTLSDREFHLWGFVRDDRGRCSLSQHIEQNDESTEQQDNETASLQDNETTSLQDNMSTGQQDNEPTGQRVNEADNPIDSRPPL